MAFKPGQSGNPRGRPRGLTDRRTKLMRAIDPDLPQLLRTIMDQALGGDMTAAGLIVSRIFPPLKARAEPVRFQFDASGSLAGQGEKVLEAIANGVVDPGTGKLVLDSLASLAQARMVEQFEDRIAKLEAKHEARD